MLEEAEVEEPRTSAHTDWIPSQDTARGLSSTMSEARVG